MTKRNSERTIDVNGRVFSVGYCSGGTFGANVRATVTPAKFSYVSISCLARKKERKGLSTEATYTLINWLGFVSCAVRVNSFFSLSAFVLVSKNEIST